MNNIKKIVFVLSLTFLSALLLCSCGTNKNIDMVKNGYMGEYTDITTQEFLDGYYLTYTGYNSSEWDGGTTDDGKEIVQVTYKSEDADIEDAVIQFTVLDGKYFTVSAFVDPMVEIEQSSDLLAELNMDYMTVYMLNHSEIAEDSDAENEFMRYLDTISGSSVLYGAAADYSGDRSLLCYKFDDTPLETSVPWLLSSAGYLYMMDYDLYYDYYGVENDNNSDDDNYNKSDSAYVTVPYLLSDIEAFLNTQPMNAMLCSSYANVLDADIWELIYQCHDDSIDYSRVYQAFEEEFGSVDLDLSYISAASFDALLTEITGYGLYNWQIDSSLYLESIDTFCIQHGDTNFSPIECDKVSEYGDGTYSVTCSSLSGSKLFLVTLRKTETGYQFISNKGLLVAK